MKKINHVALVLDNSGSMCGLVTPVKDLYKKTVQSLKDNAKLHNIETRFSFYRFSNSVMTEYTDLVISSVNGNLHYSPAGGTALYDAVGDAIKLMPEFKSGKEWVKVDEETMKLQDSDEHTYMVIVITDGEENASRQMNALNLKHLMLGKQKTDKWTFAFNVPHIHAKNKLVGWGVPADNINVWEQTEVGVREMEVKTSCGIGRFYDDRTKGVTSSQSFYTDLSSITPQDLKDTLNNSQSKFKVLDVKKECDVATFIKDNVGEYVKGNTFYQLTKSEKVQATKKIVIKEKGKGAIYEGDQARNLIGLPAGECRVRPGDHSKYEVYVQSTSLNRKLVRGTKVLVRK